MMATEPIRPTEQLTNKVVVRIGTKKDIPLIYAFIDGYDEEPIDVTINKERIKQITHEMIEQNCVLMGEVNGETIGVIAGYVAECLFSNDVMFASMFFYIMPYFRKHTREFLKEVELCLIPTKITRLVIGIPNFKYFEAQKRFMSIEGYKTLETHMYKRI